MQAADLLFQNISRRDSGTNHQYSRNSTSDLLVSIFQQKHQLKSTWQENNCSAVTLKLSTFSIILEFNLYATQSTIHVLHIGTIDATLG